MTGVREHFKEIDEKVSGKVKFGDGSYIEIKGKGSILIECDDEKQRIISHVYYIPDLKSNLLSLGQFGDGSYIEIKGKGSIIIECDDEKQRIISHDISTSSYTKISTLSTQKQATVALSSCESEFIAATAAATQALWLKRLLSKLTHTQEEKITIQVDNKSAIALMQNPVFHGRSKHIDAKYHFIRECIERVDIQVDFISGEYQKAHTHKGTPEDQILNHETAHRTKRSKPQRL
ncbi:hypothetical protein Tco_1024355 [Tanacetum coccineum]